MVGWLTLVGAALAHGFGGMTKAANHDHGKERYASAVAMPAVIPEAAAKSKCSGQGFDHSLFPRPDSNGPELCGLLTPDR